MFSDGATYLIDLHRKYFGFLAIREAVNGRKDAFFELHANEESPSDQEALRRLCINEFIKQILSYH